MTKVLVQHGAEQNEKGTTASCTSEMSVTLAGIDSQTTLLSWSRQGRQGLVLYTLLPASSSQVCLQDHAYLASDLALEA